jgi:hypothetical protein
MLSLRLMPVLERPAHALGGGASGATPRPPDREAHAQRQGGLSCAPGTASAGDLSAGKAIGIDANAGDTSGGAMPNPELAQQWLAQHPPLACGHSWPVPSWRCMTWIEVRPTVSPDATTGAKAAAVSARDACCLAPCASAEPANSTDVRSDSKARRNFVRRIRYSMDPK